MISRPRVFLDASVLFAAIYSGRGAARDLVEAGRRGEIVLIVDQTVIVETRRDLAFKAPQHLKFLAQFLESHLFEVVDFDSGLASGIVAMIEPKDAPIVAGAVCSNSRFLATYDQKHLLTQADVIF